MVFDETFGSFTTIARIHTNPVNTSFTTTTFIISYTTGWIFNGYRNAATIRVRNPTRAT